MGFVCLLDFVHFLWFYFLGFFNFVYFCCFLSEADCVRNLRFGERASGNYFPLVLCFRASGLYFDTIQIVNSVDFKGRDSLETVSISDT